MDRRAHARVPSRSMSPLARGTSALVALLFAAIAQAGCGDGGSGGSGGTGGSGGSGGSGGAGGGGDPCAGKQCGDPCSTCPDGAPCQPQACDKDGQCVGEVDVVCSTKCPAEAPADGDPCPEVGLACEVDSGVVLVCRARVQCTQNGWLSVAPGCSSDPIPDPDCPASEPSGDCDVAMDPGLCTFGDTLCGCSDCLGGPCGGQAQWVCAAPPDPPCPPVAPKLGADCTEEGLSCVYGACPLGGTSGGRTCSEGAWVEDIVACPE